MAQNSVEQMPWPDKSKQTKAGASIKVKILVESKDIHPLPEEIAHVYGPACPLIRPNPRPDT